MSTLLLLGIGIFSYQKIHASPSLQVISKSVVEEKEKIFEESKRVSLAHGTEEDFARLPHIGPALAKRIVSYRETHGFSRKEELLSVNGIGAKTYEELKDLIVLE